MKMGILLRNDKIGKRTKMKFFKILDKNESRLVSKEKSEYYEKKRRDKIIKLLKDYFEFMDIDLEDRSLNDKSINDLSTDELFNILKECNEKIKEELK